MIKNLSRALTCLFVGAALTACTGDDTGDTDTDPTTTASTSPTSSTSETSTTDSTDSTTTDATDSTTTDATDSTTTDATDSTTTTDATDSTTDATDSTTDATDSTTDATDGTTDGTTTDGGLGFAADVYPIISANCSCHVMGTKAGLTMPDAATAYANLVDVASTQAPDVPRVAPGMPGGSYIINKVEGTHEGVGGKGNQMPPGGPLSGDNIMMFKDWIADGAMP